MKLKPDVRTEIDPLQCVIVANPLSALPAINATNYQDFLFEGVPDLKKFKQEFDRYLECLSSQGVSLLYVEQLFEDALSQAGAREWFQSSLAKFGIEIADGVDAETIIAGNDKIPPSPNIHFTRDTSVWLHDRVLIGAMKYPVRKIESLILSCIYRFHPVFATKESRIIFDGSQITDPEIYIEGGDLLLFDEETLLIGESLRTSFAAIEKVAPLIFQKTGIKKIIAIMLPKQRCCMHLDMVMTFVDRGLICAAQSQIEQLTSVQEIVPHGDGIEIMHRGSFLEYFNDRIRVIENHAPMEELLAEQRACANNLLTISPAKVIGYHHPAIDKNLKRQQIAVLNVPSIELALGMGGPHCMSCPVVRSTSSVVIPEFC